MVPHNPDWLHEIKYDGYRLRVERDGNRVRLNTRNGYDWTKRFFGTLKMRMGATHFLMKRLPKVATEMALHVLAYNPTRVMNIMGPQPLMAAIRA